VLDALVEGKTNAEIALALGISVAGVRWQVSEMLGKTGLDDRQALAVWWREGREAHGFRLWLPWLQFFQKRRVETLAASVVGVVAIVAGVIIGSPSSSGRGLSADGPPGLDLGEVDQPATPTAEPSESDLAQIDAVVLQWRQWSDSAGAWNGDVLRGGDQNAREPLSLGYGTTPVVSPNGRLIVHAERESGEVTVYDLAAWTPVVQVQTAPDVFMRVWSDDSSQAYGWREYCSQPADRGICPVGLQRDLWRVDLQRAGAERLAAFDFSVMDLAIPGQRDATRAYALGVDTDICCAIDPEGDAFVAELDLVEGKVVRKIPLPGLLAGQLESGLADGSGGSYYPALLLAPDGSRLYVVDAAEDAVLTIDLESFVVESHELREKRSALSHLGDWLVSQIVSTAEAKGGASFHRQAALTPDGRYLVISGVSAQEFTRKDGSVEMANRPSGLMIVNTETMAIELREEEAAWFKLSPGGRRLLTYGSYYDEELGHDPQGGGVVAYGLKVVDLDAMKQIHRLWPDEEVQPIVFSADGRYVYVTSEGPGVPPARQAGVACYQDCSLLNLLDLAAGEVIWHGKLAENETVLAFPPP
jgi:hypothetical protein